MIYKDVAPVANRELCSGTDLLVPSPKYSALQAVFLPQLPCRFVYPEPSFRPPASMTSYLEITRFIKAFLQGILGLFHNRGTKTSRSSTLFSSSWEKKKIIFF